MIYVPGQGNGSAKLVVVGEAPGANEEFTGRPFSGPAGRLLDDALYAAGTDRNQVYVTNVVKIRPPNNKIDLLPTLGKSIDDFIPQLWEEIETINPNCILVLGNTALQAVVGVKGIEHYRGSILAAQRTGHKVVACLHPAALLHENDAGVKSFKPFTWIKADVQRAVEQSRFREIRLPERFLHVARNSLDVMRFLDRHQNRPMVTLDVETHKTWAQCIGLSFSANEAISIPTFRIGAEENEIPMHDMAHIWALLSEFLQDTKVKIVAQNPKFDQKRCRQLGLDWHGCWFSMDMGWHILCPEMPKKLEFISSLLTDEPYYKDEGKEYNPKIHRMDRWFLYNAKDAAVEYECTERILEALKEQNLYEWYFDKIQPLYDLYYDIEDAGIHVDLAIRRDLTKQYRSKWAERHEQLLDDISEGNAEVREQWKNFNVMSNGAKNQVAKLIFGFLRCPLRKDTKDETLKSLVNNVVKDPAKKRVLIGILEIRKIRKTVGTYLEAGPSYNDCQFPLMVPRIHTTCNINGAESGRTSTGILQPPVSIDKHGIALQTMTKHEDPNLDAGGGNLRAMFIADPGYSLIEPDQAQAEDRVVCVLAKDWLALEEYARKEFKYNKNGVKDDRHTKTAIAICGIGFDSITDWERQIGKKTRHAGNYAVGKHQHMLTLAKSGIFISEWKAGQQLDRFHGDNPKIRGVFHYEIQQALQDNNCRLVSPHGRPRQFLNRWGEDLFKEAYAQIPQATVSDQTKFAMVRIARRLNDIYKKEFFFLLESHDSFLALCKDEHLPRVLPIIKEELEAPIDFSHCTLSRDYQLVIPCDIKIGKRWIERSNDYPDGMSKYKAA